MSEEPTEDPTICGESLHEAKVINVYTTKGKQPSIAFWVALSDLCTNSGAIIVWVKNHPTHAICEVGFELDKFEKLRLFVQLIEEMENEI